MPDPRMGPLLFRLHLGHQLLFLGYLVEVRAYCVAGNEVFYVRPLEDDLSVDPVGGNAFILDNLQPLAAPNWVFLYSSTQIQINELTVLYN